MENGNAAYSDNKQERKTLKELVVGNIVFFTLGCMVASFLAGIGSVKTVYELAQLETVQKGSYISKDKLGSDYVLRVLFDSLKQALQMAKGDTLIADDFMSSRPSADIKLSKAQSMIVEGLVVKCDSLLKCKTDDKSASYDRLLNEILFAVGRIDNGIRRGIEKEYRIARNQFYLIDENLEKMKISLKAIMQNQ